MTTFNTPQMRALAQRLHRQPRGQKPKGKHRRQPNVGMLKVWNGNEGPTLEQLVDAVPPEGGVAALVNDLEQEGKRR